MSDCKHKWEFLQTLYESSSGYTNKPVSTATQAALNLKQAKYSITVGATGDSGYITDGTADDVQIQAAIDAINTFNYGRHNLPILYRGDKSWPILEYAYFTCHLCGVVEKRTVTPVFTTEVAKIDINQSNKE